MPLVVIARLSEDQRNHAIGMLRVGSTENNIAHHFGCSRQTIHNLVNLKKHYWVCQRPCKARSRTCDNVMYLSHYTLTHLRIRNRFNHHSLLVSVYRFHAQMIINRFMKNNGPDIFQDNNARPHKTRMTTHFLEQNYVNVLPWPTLSPVMNLIEHVWDELGRRARSNHQINTINGSSMHFCLNRMANVFLT